MLVAKATPVSQAGIPFPVCPDCGIQVPDHAMSDHRGDEACVMAQTHHERLKGLKRAGNTYKTQEKASVPFTYVAHTFHHDSHGTGPQLEYVRCAPEWAVWVSECTLLDADDRVVILEHCLEHDAARRATDTVRRLGAYNGRKVTTDAKTKKDKAAIKDFFTSLLLVTGA